jgi:hypothetical protein
MQGIEMEELITEAKSKRFRSAKCDICETVNKTVKKMICPLTLKYDGEEVETYMCKKCLDEILEDIEE